MTKLTLSVDERTIRRAKSFAKAHRTSLSKLVSRYLSSLEVEPEECFFDRLHSELEGEGFETPRLSDDEARKRHVSEKYL